MCQALEDGGKRCAGIQIRSNLSRKRKAAEEWAHRVERARTVPHPQPMRIAVYEERLAEVRNRVNSLEDELAEVHAKHKAERAAQKAEKVGKHGKDASELTVGMGSRDYDFVLAEAARRGLSSPNALITTVIGEEPAFLPARTNTEIAAKKLTDNPNGGRPTADAASKRDKRIKTRCSKVVRDCLDAEASLLYLKTSDYLLSLLMGRDPRTRGGHISLTNAKKQADKMEAAERAAGVGNGEEARQFWIRKIMDTRRSFGLID